MLMKKVDALSKAMEVESKKMKREAAARDKEAAAAKMDDNKKNRNINSSKRWVTNFEEPQFHFLFLFSDFILALCFFKTLII